jgi:hypothetical protein
LTPNAKWINYVMGTLPGWWLGEEDSRVEEPYISTERWDEELRKAGFAGAEVTVLDNEEPYQMNSQIFASVPISNTSSTKADRVTLLRGATQDSLVQEVKPFLCGCGYEVDVRSLGEELSSSQVVVSLLDLEKPFLHGVSSSDFDALLKFSTTLGPAGVLWLTKPSQVLCEDPRYAMILGFARTVRAEYGVDFATLELDVNSWEHVVKVLRKFQERQKDSEVEPEYEYALTQGTIQISRGSWFPITKELSAPTKEGAAKRLAIRRPGFLKTLGWEQYDEKALNQGELELDMKAAGMNFKVCCSPCSQLL